MGKRFLRDRLRVRRTDNKVDKKTYMVYYPLRYGTQKISTLIHMKIVRNCIIFYFIEEASLTFCEFATKVMNLQFISPKLCTRSKARNQLNLIGKLSN